MKILVFLVYTFIAVLAIETIDVDDLKTRNIYVNVAQEQWETFKVTYNRTYRSDVEEELRMKIYLENKLKISKHNQLFEKGEVSFRMKENQYADMLHSEFVEVVNGFRSHPEEELVNTDWSSFISPANVQLPTIVDWRDEGAVTKVKNQLSCGSCWAFSATGSLEGQNFRKTGQLVSLSEQNLVDCSDTFGNLGCNGGSMAYAFNYVKVNGGIDTEESYPYNGYDGTCNYGPANSGATCTGYVMIPRGDEAALQSAVATVGPISVAIDASQSSFQFYGEGVYYEPYCSSTALDHGVLVVGYNSYVDEDYWIVKNSWGTTWGQNGYIWMARNRNNNCGIATSAIYPLV